MIKTLGMAMLLLGMFLAAFSSDSNGSAAPAQPAGTGGTRINELTLDVGNGLGMKLARIPAGKFLMGSPKDEKDRQDDEGLPPGRWENDGPQIEVTISKPFYLGITNVTVDQYALFVRDTGHETNPDAAKDDFEPSSWRKPGFEQAGNHPVVNLSWNDAQAFCKWLSKRTGKTGSPPKPLMASSCIQWVVVVQAYADSSDKLTITEDQSWIRRRMGWKP